MKTSGYRGKRKGPPKRSENGISYDYIEKYFD